MNFKDIHEFKKVLNLRNAQIFFKCSQELISVHGLKWEKEN